MKEKRRLRKFVALLLSVLLLLCAAQVPAVTKNLNEINLAIISDLHVYPDAMTGGHCEAYMEKQGSNGRAIESTQGLFTDALADLKSRAENEKTDFLLIPGDMSEWGEYEGHILVADMLKTFEADTGISVALIPGNHDINNKHAVDFTTGEGMPARALMPNEFWDIYADLGYDLPGLDVLEGTLSYAADLGSNYRLIAMDTERWLSSGEGRCSREELREWVLEQCEKANTDGKTIIGMGHHNLGEQIGGQDSLMSNFGFENVSETAEAFADAGMHFYFSGHLHFNEIAMRVSDSGEPLYDIITAASAFFPGGYRTVKFGEENGRIEADVQSHSVALTNPPPFSQAYYESHFGRSFGGTDGSGIVGWLKHAVKYSIEPTLRGISLEDMVKQSGFDFAPLNILLKQLDRRLFDQPERLMELIYKLVEDAAGLTISEVPCTSFIEEYGFGDYDKPGTLEDLANSIMVYLFGKRHNAADDPFMEDVLNRMRSGVLLDCLLEFAVPKIIETVGDDLLPMLLNNPVAINALAEFTGSFDYPAKFIVTPLLAIAAGSDLRKTMSESLYQVALGVISCQSPTGSPDGLLVYDGSVDVPTNPSTFRLPQALSVDVKQNSATITWYTRRSAHTPVLSLSDKNGNPVTDVSISISSHEENITAGQIDMGFTKLMGQDKPVLKHTATVEGLKFHESYYFTAGDSEKGWFAEPQQLSIIKENAIILFFKQLWNYLTGLLNFLQL